MGLYHEARAAGKLADPTDLPFDESHLDDLGALRAAVDDLIARKPNLASRRPAVKSAKQRHPPPVPSIWSHVGGNEPDKHGCPRPLGQAVFKCAARHSRN